MDDSQAAPLSSRVTPRLRDWHWLVLLFVLVIPLRGWFLLNTEVLARDSVGFIRIALRFDLEPWGEVLRGFDQHPGYPSAIWLVSTPVRAWNGETTPEVMRVSVQLASAMAAILLLFPMFFLGKALWDARVGFGGALLFQFLPVSGRHLADGISESLFVCCVAWSLMFGVWALQSRRVRCFAGCGAFAGLAYLTRPEGAILLVAAGFVLLAMQMRRDWRQSWRQFTLQAACLIGPALLVGSVYFIPTGRFSNKPSVNQFVTNATSTLSPGEPRPPRPSLTASLWADSFIEVRSPVQRMLFGLWALVSELASALFYVGCVPVVIGLAWQGGKLLRNHAGWLLAAYFCMHAGALILLAVSAGYLSDRHLMPLIMILCCVTMIGLLQIAAALVSWKTRAAIPAAHFVTATALALLALEIGVDMPQTLKRLHSNREGNHDAGLWLAERVQPGDIVLDDHDWTNYYSGLMLLEGKEPPAPRDYQPMCYVVITRSNDYKVGYIRKKRERELQFSKGEIVYHWPKLKPVEDARIVIYALPRNPKVHPWRVAQN